jgi:protein ImuB
LWYAVVFPGLAGAEPAALQRLALHAQRFTSLVSLEPPDALLLEIRGSLKVFGPAEVLHAAIDAVWRGMPVPASSAAAPSTLAALWFARSGRRVLIEDPAALSGRLADLPIACTGWDAERLRSLRAMGVTRLGELLRLPRTGIARRLGSALFDLDIALARLPSVRRAFVPRERFRERCDFDAEVESVDALDRALEPLIGSCCRFLRERQAGVLALLLKLRHRVGPVTRLRLGLASVTGERRRLQEVLTHTLVGLALAAPVRGVELVSGPLQALPAGSLDAFAGSPRTPGCDTAPQLVERLRARLGEASVYGLCSLAEHRPEAARGRVHAPWLAGGPAAGRAHSGIGAACRNGADMPRPLWLLDEPLPLSEQEVRQLGAGGLILEEGPERIESGWWDGKGVARDYYRARRTQGSRLWVFQERHTRRWYVHGVFA